MENALAVDEFDGLEELIHEDLDFLLVEFLVLDKTLIEILLHEFEDEC